MSKAITTVTTLQIRPNIEFPDKPGTLKDSRCVGYFFGDHTAMLVVLQNQGDIYENGLYNYAVIERIEEGLYPHPTSFQWFKWDKEMGGYIDCCPPKGFENTSNFGIG